MQKLFDVKHIFQSLGKIAIYFSTKSDVEVERAESFTYSEFSKMD